MMSCYSGAMTPNMIIAAAIRRERALAQMSLSALAARAGLAKSTLSQLEAGKGNPNVETLWAIATALNLPFSALFDMAAPTRALIRAHEGAGIGSDQADFMAVLLDKCPPDRRRDLYRLHLRQGAARRSEPHPPGTLEHAILCTGRVRLGPQGDEVELGPGDYLRYGGDAPHSYQALTPEALLIIIMDSPR